jgi:hypothetical protein
VPLQKAKQVRGTKDTLVMIQNTPWRQYITSPLTQDEIPEAAYIMKFMKESKKKDC